MSDKDKESSQDKPSWDELISLKEAAKLSGLSYSHLRYLARNNEIWAERLGHNWFTTEQAVRKYIARNRRPGPKPKEDPGSGS